MDMRTRVTLQEKWLAGLFDEFVAELDFEWERLARLSRTEETNEGLCLSCSISDRPAAALGAFQALPREGPGLLPERRRVFRHRDAQRASQALQVSVVVALLSPAGCFRKVVLDLSTFKRTHCTLMSEETNWVSLRLLYLFHFWGFAPSTLLLFKCYAVQTRQTHF